MIHRRRPQLMTTVDAQTLVIINDFVDETDLAVERALDIIVQEWEKSRKPTPFEHTQNQSNSAISEKALKDIEERLIQIEEILDGARIVTLD